MTVVGIWDFGPMAQTEFSEYRSWVPRFLSPCGIRGQNNPRMNPPQFFAEIKRPNVSVLLGAFATSGWLSLQAIAILWAALEAMARGMKLLVRAMAPRKTQPRVILESTKEMSATLC